MARGALARPALQSVRITLSRKDSQSTLLREKSKVRGMIVKGMGKSVVRFIPLTTIPLTSLRLFLSAISHPASVAAGRAGPLR